jgi:preprotein translocase subunit YajC
MLQTLAQAGAPERPQGGLLDALVQMAPMFLVIWLIWWLLVLRPQKQQQRHKEERLGALKKGDKVRTRGGIVGAVSKIHDDVVVLRDLTDGKSQVTVLKSAIEDLHREEEKAEK